MLHALALYEPLMYEEAAHQNNKMDGGWRGGGGVVDLLYSVIMEIFFILEKQREYIHMQPSHTQCKNNQIKMFFHSSFKGAWRVF
jgi:hypothetical protein